MTWNDRVVQYCDIMRFMILCDRHHKVSPYPNPQQNMECVHMTSRRPCWRRKQRNSGHVGGVKYSFGDWTLFLCKFLLLFHYANMVSGHMSEHTLLTVLQCMTLCDTLWCPLWSTVNLIMSQYWTCMISCYDHNTEFLTDSARDGSVASPYTLITQAPFLDLKRGWTGVNKVLPCILTPAWAFVSAYHSANYSKKNLTTNVPFVIVTVR